MPLELTPTAEPRVLAWVELVGGGPVYVELKMALMARNLDTKPTKQALMYVVGSVLEESNRVSTKPSVMLGPPTTAPTWMLGLGFGLWNQFT